jgi:dTDP-4-dehydrorhamnose reductase
LNQKNILVTGANGQLGSEFRVLSEQYPQYHFVFSPKEDLPIEDSKIVNQYFESQSFDYCINCAAYTQVDAAETEKELAFRINAEAVENLASACNAHGVQFIHVSTDYVFDGTNKEGYTETDPTCPLNVYGASKLGGEIAAMKANTQSIIIRTSWVYSFFGKNFVKTMMRLMKEKASINVVDDQIGRPTYAADLANAIMNIIAKQDGWVPGIYHYANEGAISWFDFAKEIKKWGGYTCDIHPIPSSSYPVPAKRPNYSILKTEKIISVFHLTVPSWKDSLHKCMQLLLEQ